VSTQAPHQSLSRRFNLALLALYAVSVVVTAPLVYWYTRDQVYDRANEDLDLLVDVVKSIQSYVATDLRPHLTGQGIFYSPAISGIVATSRVAEHFKKEQPQYLIKNASDNPLNPVNLATGVETKFLERFRADRKLEGIHEAGVFDNRPYLVSAAPKISNKKGCMRCHGDPADAPEDVIKTYGTGAGYGYEFNDVVGVSLVGVPLQDVQSLALQRSLVVIGGLTLLFAVLFVVVNQLVQRLILKPISEITDVAKAVSGGDVNRVVSSGERTDEIGDLANSFELMRRSLVAAMKRMQKR
jgi:HAMP domain-containing protein